MLKQLVATGKTKLIESFGDETALNFRQQVLDACAFPLEHEWSPVSDAVPA
jgi:hypothetical protein